MSTERSRLSRVMIGLAFAVPMGALVTFYSGNVTRGIVTGAISGALFAALVGNFTRRVERDPALDAAPGGGIALDDGETLVRQGLANHFKRFESVGGKLFLTDRRLRFVSHGLNVQTHDESYPLGEIVRVEATRTLGIIPNGLRVTLADGRHERFVVYGRREWVTAIDALRNRAAAPFRDARS